MKLDNKIFLGDCIKYMKEFILENEMFDLTLTDIPYGGVNRESNGLRELDKGNADVVTFDLLEFAQLVFDLTKSTVIIFCGQQQVSGLYKFFLEKQKNRKGTVRQLIWQKTNPSPMNGRYIYLSGIENAIWFKKRGGTFNAHCKNTVFVHPSGRNKLHPTEKNHALIDELILDNSKMGDIVFDPCFGSGTHLVRAKNIGRKYCGIEIDKKYFKIAEERLIQ